MPTHITNSLLLVTSLAVGSAHISQDAMFLAQLLLPLSALFLIIFFLSIDKNYLGTFMSIEKGKEITIRRFMDSKKAEHKAKAVFTKTFHHWSSIEEDVRGWVESNWTKWQEEKPAWLDERMLVKNSISLHSKPGRSKERRREKE